MHLGRGTLRSSSPVAVAHAAWLRRPVDTDAGDPGYGFAWPARRPFWGERRLLHLGFDSAAHGSLRGAWRSFFSRLFNKGAGPPAGPTGPSPPRRLSPDMP